MANQDYSNYAFISYKREDEKWAKWLQKKLESYKLPSSAHEHKSDLPKYLRPIFRDSTDLSGGILADKLKQELLNSRFLIVVCSPNASKSEWVNKEVQTFIDEGRIGQIIPFIIGGTPHSANPYSECFPKALLDIPADKELLGINVSEVGKNMAFMRLISTMIGVRFDTLWQRHRRQQIRRGVALGFVAVLLLGLAIFLWDYYRATYKYYTDYVDCYGVPEGILPLTDEQVSHRSGSYQFEYHRIPFGEPDAYTWRITKVSLVNSALCPVDEGVTDRYPILEIDYNKQTGIVSRINFCDTKGKVLLRHVLSEREGVTAAVADFVNTQEQRGSGFIGSNLTSLGLGQMEDANKSNIVRFVYKRDEKGHIVQQTYHANNDYQLKRSAICDADGIFGLKFTLDSLGRRIKENYIGINEEYVCTRKGVAGIMKEYDERGTIHKETYINQECDPVLNEQMWASAIATSDEWGNLIEVACYGIDGNPCYNSNKYSKYSHKYNDKGFIVEEKYYDIEGRPCIIEDGFAITTIEYDKYGKHVTEKCFDTEGNPILNNYWWSVMKARYNKKGDPIELSLFDANGDPCMVKDGFAQKRMKYDSNGNMTEKSFFDSGDNPCFINEGLSVCKYRYDDQGHIIEESYFDTEEDPCFIEEGYSKCKYKFDDRGNIIAMYYYDVNDELCLTSYSIAAATIKYDDRGHDIELSYYGIDGEPCLCQDGFARTNCEYDDHGNLTRQYFYGIDGEPCTTINGTAGWISSYDERGYEIERTFYGVTGELCMCEDGYAKYVYKYDERGFLIEIEYYDTEGMPCLCNAGFFKRVSDYDDRGNVIKLSFFGTDQLPCYEMNGVSVNTCKYDDRNNMIESAYYDTDGNLTISTEGAALWRAEYDEKGNRVVLLFYGIDGELCLCDNGYAKSVSEFDDRGNVISTTYYDTNGCRCLTKDYFSKLTSVYDVFGFQVTESYWGINDEPVELAGFHYIEYLYDERHEVTGSNYYDKDNQIIEDYVITDMVLEVSGLAEQSHLPVHSILLRWNDWTIGDSIDDLSIEHNKNIDSPKDMYYLTPDSTIIHLCVDQGRTGVRISPIYIVRKERVKELVDMLEQYKSAQ